MLLHANAGQQINFTGSLFYNSTNNTITVQYWITNTSTTASGGGCGNNNVNIAVLNLGLQWNPAVVTLSSWSFMPPGKGLDSSDYFDGNASSTADDIPDATIRGIRAINPGGKTDSTIDFIRSTNWCDNTIYLTCNQTALLFQAVFTISPALAASNYYDFTHPNDNTNYPNFIAEFNNGTSNTSNVYKEILFISNRPFDEPGSNCPPGTALGNNVNNLPDDNAPDVFVNTQAPLPVSLLYFEAFKQNNKNILQWQTATELNAKGFEIQRKLNGSFETIGYVPSQSTGGYSENMLNYNFTDPDVQAGGTVYYRLHQVNYLAKDSYSEIKAIRNNSKFLQVLIYPNPSNGNINIVLPDGNGTTDIKMIDFSGKLIKTWTGYKIPNIQLSALPKGIYTLLISNRESGEKVTSKITVQ